MYITANRPQRYHQISFDDIISGFDESMFIPQKNTRDTVTWHTSWPTNKLTSKVDVSRMFLTIKRFNDKYANLIGTEDKSTLYRSFKIPKRSGGLRQIDAPLPELMGALGELKEIFEKEFFFTYHTCAFAYVKGRNAIDAVRRHQKNNSRWILKTDIHGFFNHTTPEFVMRMLKETFPFGYCCEFTGFEDELKKALSLCFLNGGLPQGTPISPMLTNQMMIPIDYAINKICHQYTPHICYTRYADDMDFSSEYSFHWTDFVAEINKLFRAWEVPFEFNKEKTHYGSTSGRNWMLGVMLNKDNAITVGHENKKTFKTSLFAFGHSVKNRTPWSIEDTQHLMGLLAYYKQVEGDPIDQIVGRYSEKFGFDLTDAMKKIIKGEIHQ